MCLTHISEKKVAEKDITCWKKLLYSATGEYVTMFYGMKVKVGKIYFSDIEVKGIYVKYIERALHSYAHRGNEKPSKFIIHAKCTIPMGSVYYEGIFQGRKSYASEILRYDEIIIK